MARTATENTNDSDIWNEHFRRLRPLTAFAGVIGVIQSLIWLTLSVMGILSFYCYIYVKNVRENMATVTWVTFLEMYFREASCASAYPLYDFSPVLGQTVLNSAGINILMYVYLAVSFIWFISSVSLLTSVNRGRLRQTSAVILIWSLVTLAVSVIDLGMGIIFGIDLATLLSNSTKIGLGNPDAVIYISAQISVITMLLLTFKGFVLWIINSTLGLYLFSAAIAILNRRNKEAKSVGYDNNAFSSDTHSLNRYHPPIDAYQTSTRFGEALPPLRVNVEALKRANVMSEQSLYASYERRMAEATKNKNVKKNSSKSATGYNNSSTGYWQAPYVPQPDYTPPMPRSNKFVNNNSSRSNIQSVDQNNNKRNSQPAFLNTRYQ